ncbi:cupredoxin domain-containing protein, partial [Candidatus Woesearchaeota archaeon]|nr:cupredoxin domain-containing protein [Candidatus Woesearchaeota archaeon]
QFSFEPSTIEVNKGDKVRLIVTSVDVPHGFAIPEYDINERLDPGKEVVIEFTANKQGTFTVFCSVFCGSGHSGMKGKIIVK